MTVKTHRVNTVQLQHSSPLFDVSPTQCIKAISFSPEKYHRINNPTHNKT